MNFWRNAQALYHAAHESVDPTATLPAAMLVVPVGLILFRTFQPGIGAFIEQISTPAAISALQLSLLIVAIVVPLMHPIRSVNSTPGRRAAFLVCVMWDSAFRCSSRL